MAVVGSVGREGFAAVLAFEGLLPRMLPDVRAEDAGSGELLQDRKRKRELPSAGRPITRRV